MPIPKGVNDTLSGGVASPETNQKIINKIEINIRVYIYFNRVRLIFLLL